MPMDFFLGINYGPFHEKNQKPGTPISDTQFISDLKIISPYFDVIKTYGIDKESRLDSVVPLIAKYYPHTLQVYQGILESPEYNSNANKEYLDTAIQLANQYPDTVAAIVVGNECLPGDPNPSISIDQLLLDLQYVKNGLKGNTKTMVTTNLTYAAANYPDYRNKLDASPSLDFVMINIYPFYASPNGIIIDKAIDNLIVNYNNFKTLYSKEVLIGETGWPSASTPPGQNNGLSVPSVANEQKYTKDIGDNDSKLGPTFIFGAFDESWLIEQNSWGPHWGLWDSNGKIKFPL